MSVTPDHPAAVRLPVARVAAWVFAAIGVVSGVGAALAVGVAPDAARSALAGGAASLIGAAFGLAPIVLASQRPAVAAAMAQVVGSSARLLVGAACAVVALLAGGFDAAWVLGTFLAAMAGALVVEVAVVTPALAPARSGTEGRS